ncbi:MAG: antitoxin [Bryobacterales bacterium]|nr:antitoxin [Bryobacterales bacterium]
MSHRLQVLISTELDLQLRKAAQRKRMSKGEWVRRTLSESLRQAQHTGAVVDPLARLSSLDAPTADIDAMIRDIEHGRS